MAFLLKILIARCVLGCEPNGARSIRGGYPSLLDVLSHRTIRNEIAGWIEIRERGFFSHSSMESLITSRHSPSKRLCFYISGNDRNISGLSLELVVEFLPIRNVTVVNNARKKLRKTCYFPIESSVERSKEKRESWKR